MIMYTFHTAAVPLNSNNICKELEGVNPQSLGAWLIVPQSRFKQHATCAEQMKAIIEYWLSVDPTPSWRRLLWALVGIGEHKKVKKMELNLEPLTGN